MAGSTQYGVSAVKVSELDTNRYATYTWSVSRARNLPPGLPHRPFSEEEAVVTKKEIVRTISEEIGMTQLQTKGIVQKTFNAIVKALVEERRIELRNFGVFEVKKRAPRKARNPRTGEKVFVQEKYVVTFKPGKEMEERVRQLEQQETARSKAEAAARGASESLQGSATGS